MADAELPVSPDVAIQLEHALRALGDAPPARLRGVARAVIVKTRDPEVNRAVDAALARWIAQPVVPRARLVATPPPVDEAPTPARWPALVAILILLAGMVWWVWPPTDEATPDAGPADAAPVDHGPRDAGVRDQGVEGPRESFRFPKVTVRPQPTDHPASWPDGLLLIGALIGIGVIGWRYRGLFEDPPPAPPLEDVRAPLPLPPPAGPIEMLDREEQRAVLWGIGRYDSDERTRRIDVPATVAATARTATPTLRFEPARRAREIWLWCDLVAAEAHPEIRRLSDHLVRVLRSGRLPVHRAWFDGVPFELWDDDDFPIAPEAVEDAREYAHLAILTDGHMMQLWEDDPEVVRRLTSDLDAFGRWPHAALVDFADGGYGLDSRALQHGITWLRPDQLVDWIADAASHRVPASRHAIERWAAACALGLEPVAEKTAVALHEALALDAPIWALAELRTADGTLDPERADHDALLTWLAESERGADTLLDRARAWWIARYTSTDATAGSRQARWQQVMANLIGLWTRDARAIERCAAALRAEQALFDAEIRGWLGRWSPDLVDGCARLPWRWDALSPQARCWLAALGLAGRPPQEDLRRGRRVHLTIAAFAIVALTAVIGWVTANAPPPAPHRVVPIGAPPSDFVRTDEVFGRRRLVERLPIGRPGEETRIEWAATDVPCVVTTPERTTWRCGRTLNDHPTGAGWPARMRYVLHAQPGDPAAAALALRLLDNGAADRVDFVLDLDRGLVITATDALASEQLVIISKVPIERPRGVDAVVVAADWDALANVVHRGPPTQLAEVWPAAPIEGAAVGPGGDVSPDCVPGQTQVFKGVEFVRICRGSFEMGSEHGRENERPVHRVTLTDDFWMAKTETTVEAWLRCVRSGRCNGLRSGSDCSKDSETSHPANCADWNQATAFCGWLGGRLPTEAEWEYAARADTTTRWSHGDDEARLGEFAWFGEGIDDKAHSVAQKKPNPWGLFDMHGNVLEWVHDTYAPYAADAEADPTGGNSALLIVAKTHTKAGGAIAAHLEAAGLRIERVQPGEEARRLQRRTRNTIVIGVSADDWQVKDDDHLLLALNDADMASVADFLGQVDDRLVNNRWGRVLRGGAFGVSATYLRSARRDWDDPLSGGGDAGFRCVLSPRRLDP